MVDHVATVLVFCEGPSHFREVHRHPLLDHILCDRLLLGDELALPDGSWTIYRRVWLAESQELRLYAKRL